jgi:xanthosine utilization system XapX-like protein
MFWTVVGSSLVGAALVAAALRILPRRFPAPRLAAATGLVGALVGGIITRWVLGPGDPVSDLLAAVVVAVAALSLLIRNQPAAAIAWTAPR